MDRRRPTPAALAPILESLEPRLLLSAASESEACVLAAEGAAELPADGAMQLAGGTHYVNPYGGHYTTSLSSTSDQHLYWTSIPEEGTLTWEIESHDDDPSGPALVGFAYHNPGQTTGQPYTFLAVDPNWADWADLSVQAGDYYLLAAGVENWPYEGYFTVYADFEPTPVPDLEAHITARNEPWTWGDTVTADLRVDNLGGSAGGFRVRLVASNDATIGNGDDVLIQTWDIAGLSEGSNWPRTHTWDLPDQPYAGMSCDGFTYFGIEAGPAAGETVLINNSSYDSVDMSCVIPPDLSAGNASHPIHNSAEPGSRWDGWSVSVTNDPAAGPLETGQWTLQWVLSDDTVIDAADHVIATQTKTDTFTVGQTRQYSLTNAAIPTTIGSAGYRYFGVRVYSVPGETDTSDNTTHVSDAIWVQRADPDAFEDDVFENNDTYGDATDLTSHNGGPLSGTLSWRNLTIDARGDDDWHRFETLGSGPMTVTVDDFIDTEGDLNLYVYDDSLAEIGRSESRANRETVTFDATAGHEYYAMVRGALDDVSFGSDFDGYRLLLIAPYAQWTVMAYLDGDNNLEGILEADLDRLSSPGSRAGVSIVALLDRSPDCGGSDSETSLYVVEHDGAKTEVPLSAIDPTWSTELAMDSPDTLASFATWAIGSYPADNYLLVLRDHGNSWLGCCEDDTTALDTTTGLTAALSLQDLGEALSAVKDFRGGVDLELLVFDACVMGSMEVAYSVEPYVEYVVSSELTKVSQGRSVVDWEGVVETIQSDPSITPEVLAEEVVNIVRSEVDSGYLPEETHTWSAIDLLAFSQEVMPAHERFSSALLTAASAGPYEAQISAAKQ